MPQVSPATTKNAKAFCGLCQRIYDYWITHYHLSERLPERLQQERNITEEEFAQRPYGQCLQLLTEISQPYIILEIAKLHDPARQGSNENLSINFFVNQKEFWSEEEELIIKDIVSELDDFYKFIKEARNKILAHNDLSVYENNQPLGGFPQGEDKNYFRALGRLCSIIWNKFDLNPMLPYGDRSFDFTKSGIPEDSSDPSHHARELIDLIVGTIPKIYDDFDQTETAP